MPTRNSGGISQVSTRFSLSMEMSRLTRDGTAELVSRDQILRRERGQGNNNFPCSADHVQDWQSYPVDPYSCYMCDHTYIHTYIHVLVAVNGSIPTVITYLFSRQDIPRSENPGIFTEKNMSNSTRLRGGRGGRALSTNSSDA